jgi:hypothetical protein
LLAALLNAAILAGGTPPSVPANVSAVLFSPSQVSVEWSASAGSSGVAGYHVYRNGSLLATTAVPYHMDSTAAASTPYTYTVAAYDAAGDVSAQSAPVNVTTPAPGVPATLFGIDQNSASDHWPPTTGQGKAAPATALRLWIWVNDVKWTDIETCDAAKSTGYAPTDPKNPCYNWTNLNTWVRTMAPQAGMDVLYTFGGTPGWATSQVAPPVVGCSVAGTYSCLPPLDVDRTPGSGLGDGTDATWIDFLTALVTQYKGQIQFYELWNEPDAPNFWSGTNAQFARLARDAAAVIRATDPAARIVGPSFHGPTAATWFTQYLDLGGAADFDIVNFHGRGDGTANAQPESVIAVYNQAEAVIVAHKLTNLPFWDDEAGWRASDDVDDPDEEAAYVSREYILHASLGLGRFYWYQWDAPTGGHDLQGTKAGTAYAQVADWLVGATISACTEKGTVYSCTLARPGGYQGLLLWNTSESCSAGVCGTLPGPAPTGFVQYRDVAGDAPVKIQQSSVPVGAKPILLENMAAPVTVTVQTNPEGLQFSVDGGAPATAPQTLGLAAGSHTLTVASPQPGAASVEYSFEHWSDGSTANPRTITVGSGAATYTADFTTAATAQFELTISASPASGGTVTPASGTLYNSGTVVPISATPASGYTFQNWTGNVADPNSAATTVTMTQAQTVTANFTAQSRRGLGRRPESSGTGY